MQSSVASFLVKDEFSKQLDSFGIQLVNFGFFKQDTQKIIKNDLLNNFKLTIIKKGECVIYNDQQTIHMKTNDIVLISPFAFYSAECISEEPVEFYYIRFDVHEPTLRYPFMTFYHLSLLNYYPDAVNDAFLKHLERASSQIDKQVPGYFYHCENLLREILNQIIKNNGFQVNSILHEQKNYLNEEKLILQAILYLDEHITENLTVNDLCEYVHVSQSYLYQSFKSVLNTSTKTFMSNYRLKYITSDLKYSRLSINQIADKYNFSSAYSFTNWFIRLTKQSPTTYRKREKKK